MSKQISYSIDARNSLKAGVDALANAVKVTLGPKGKNVIIGKKYGAPVITKDGVSVAREIELEDPMENMGAQIVKEVAAKTADIAGDGTTTATVLAQAIISAGLKNVSAGANPMDLKRGIDKAVIEIVKDLKEQSEIVSSDNEKLKNVATISANSDESIGSLIAEAMKKVGESGVVTVQEATGTETEMKFVEGMQFDRGYTSPYFVTDTEKMETLYDNPLILIVDSRIQSIKEFIPVLEKVGATGRPFLIISDDMDQDVISTLVVNRLRNQFKVVAIKSPGFGQFKKPTLEDIAILTGGTLITEDHGFKLENVGLDQMGTAERIIVTKDSTTIVNGSGDPEKLEERIKQLKNAVANVNNEYEKEKLQERLAKLTGGVAILYIGAATELELKEKKDRVDDALHATRAALSEGIVAGGGVAFIRAIGALDNLVGDNEDEKTGINIIRRAIEEPLRQICSNAGIEGSVVIQKVKEGTKDFGYNAKTDVYENLISAGVIDPTKVARVALENAASVASMLLTTECVIVEKASDDVNQMSMGGGMM